MVSAIQYIYIYMIKTAAYDQLKWIVEHYGKILPISTFPYVNLAIAAVFQVLAWFGGKLFPGLSLVPRVLALWGFALIEYIFMSPTMSACIELLGYTESFLVILNHSLALIMFVILNSFIFKSSFTIRHLMAMILIFIAIWLIHAE